jgi:hypothetical protein
MSYFDQLNLRKRKFSFSEEAEIIQAWSWLSIRLNWPIFERNDLSSRLIIKQIEQLRINKDVDTILCRAFIGGSGGRQLEEFNTAIGRAQVHFRQRGIRLIVDCLCNDFIKNEAKFSPTTLVDRMMDADFHLGITHFHEGNISKTSAWNIRNILSNLDRLKHHLGNLMGDSNDCPIFRQGKKEVYDKLPAYCLPTLTINVPKHTWNPTQVISSADKKRLIK